MAEIFLIIADVVHALNESPTPIPIIRIHNYNSDDCENLTVSVSGLRNMLFSMQAKLALPES